MPDNQGGFEKWWSTLHPEIMYANGQAKEEFFANPGKAVAKAAWRASADETIRDIALMNRKHGLRDGFAMAALTGLGDIPFPMPDKIAKLAYDIADAMMVEREKYQ